MVGRIDGNITTQQTHSADNRGPDMDVQVVKVQSIEIKNNLQESEKRLSADQAKKMTESMNKFMESSNTQLRFRFHDKLNEYYVTIVNPDNDEVIREIPSKKLMDIHAAMREFLGLLVDRKI